MATTPQVFNRRVKERVTRERPTLTFRLQTTDEDENGNEYVARYDDFEATAPTEEQLMVLMARGGSTDATNADEMASILDFFKNVLTPRGYKVLMGRFTDPNDLDVDAETLIDVFEWLLGEWQDFPTMSPADSTGTRASSGTKSTGRVRGKGSTRSN